MATRPRPTASRPRGAVRPVYESFSPISEWKQEDESHILLLYLPGFMKENIKVSTEGRNVVRIHGQRLVAANKWQLFQKYFQVPEACSIRGIQARFAGGILTITVPKEISDTSSTAATSIQVGPEGGEARPTNIQPRRHQDATGEQPISQKIPEDITEKAATTTDTKKQIPDGQKGQVEHETSRGGEVIVDARKEKQTNEKNIEPKSRDTETKGKLTESAMLSENDMKRSVDEEMKSAGEDKDKEASEAGNSRVIINRITDKMEEKKDHELRAEAFAAVKAKQSTKLTARGVDGGGDDHYEREKYKQKREVGKGVLMGLNEDRQLMVNIGVAVLVLVAFGAYVSLTCCPSGRPKH